MCGNAEAHERDASCACDLLPFLKQHTLSYCMTLMCNPFQWLALLSCERVSQPLRNSSIRAMISPQHPLIQPSYLQRAPLKSVPTCKRPCFYVGELVNLRKREPSMHRNSFSQSSSYSPPAQPWRQSWQSVLPMVALRSDNTWRTCAALLRHPPISLNG
jgi:hypothetical protein